MSWRLCRTGTRMCRLTFRTITRWMKSMTSLWEWRVRVRQFRLEYTLNVHNHLFLVDCKDKELTTRLSKAISTSMSAKTRMRT